MRKIEQKKNLEILNNILTKPSQNLHTVLIEVNYNKFYVEFDSGYRSTDSELKFDCFDERFGTNTYPKFSVKLMKFERDAETLLIKLYNKIKNG